MANAYPTGYHKDPEAPPAGDRGLFDCFGKKEEKEDVPMTEAEHKPSLMEKLHRSNSSSSSSSEEEVEEGGVKIRRRKKKGLTDKIKEKLPGHKNEGAVAAAKGDYDHHSAAVTHEGEKKGIIEKIKEKLPGHHKDETVIAPHPAPAHAPAYAAAPAPAYVAAPAPVHAHVADPAPVHAHAAAPTSPHCQSGGHCGGHGAHEQPEKKGIFEKIKEKLPGGHKDGDEVKKDY